MVSKEESPRNISGWKREQKTKRVGLKEAISPLDSLSGELDFLLPFIFKETAFKLSYRNMTGDAGY